MKKPSLSAAVKIKTDFFEKPNPVRFIAFFWLNLFLKGHNWVFFVSHSLIPTGAALAANI